MDNPVDGRIPLIITQQAAYVWDVNGMHSILTLPCTKPLSDIATLRSEHRICGILTGTLPHLSQQNVFLGVPLALMPEETVYLVDKGIYI